MENYAPVYYLQLIEETVARKPKHHHLADGYVPGDRPFSQVGG